MVEDFFHYASIGRYDLAKSTGEKVLASGASPADVLAQFEKVIDSRNRRVPAHLRLELYERMLSWQRVAEMKELSIKFLDIFNKAKKERASDPAFIEQNIKRLGAGTRAYLLAMEQLKQSGEVAVPLLLATLKDPQQKDLHVAVRSALRDLGHRALNPLLAATELKDRALLPSVISALGDLGYEAAVPYLARLARQGADDIIKTAARSALVRLGAESALQASPAELFYGLAEKFYYGKCSVAAAKDSPTTLMWFAGPTTIEKREVPSAVFNELMAMRACEYVLALDPSRMDAVSLWLAAAFRREIDLPQGAADPVWDEKHPAADYYARAAGVHHLNAVLRRAMRDQDAALALKAIKALQAIVGTVSLFGPDGDKPILSAMRFGDRLVRFEAAFTVAEALPQQPFAGQEQVVPIMAEALRQTGKAGVLVLASSQDELNQRVEMLGKSGAYIVKGGISPQTVLAASAALPGVDVIVAHENAAEQIDRLMTAARGNVRLERAALLVIVTSKAASRYAAMAAGDPLITVTEATDEAGLTAAIEEARKRAGGLPLDEKLASECVLRSAALLGKLAISRGQVLDLTVAQPALLAVLLDDAHIENARAAGNVLALLGGREVQTALAGRALDEKTGDELRVSLLKNLATHAKFFGNLLDQPLKDALTRLVESGATMEVRAAAAEAHGALDLPAEQVKTLILNQAKK